MNTFTNSNGIEFKVGDFVTCYFAGYFRITGFKDYEDIFGKNVPQVCIQQLYDTHGNPKKSKKDKSCMAESLIHVTPATISDFVEIENERLRLKVQALNKMIETESTK